MDWKKQDVRLALVVMLFMGALACRTVDSFIAQATVTSTRTPRPTFTPIPPDTDTPVPTETKPPPPTARPTATRRPPTPRPTARPPTAVPPPAQPPAPPPPPPSTFEFHANPPLPCAHSGMTYLKGSVYNDRNDPNNKYVGAIVALGPPDGSTIWDHVKTDANGEYTFVLSNPGQPRPGTWALWLVDPSLKRKSDIGGPIITNDLPADNPQSCWAGGVDFWK